MPKKKHVTREEFTNKIYYGKYTNRILMKPHYVGMSKLKKFMIDIDHKLTSGYENKIIYYMNADHDKIMDILTKKVKVKRIEVINRPYNDKAQIEMQGDKHLVVVKALPFKKYRYKVVFDNLRDKKPNLDFLKAQSALGTVRLSYMIQRYFDEANGTRNWWWYGDDYFYVEDEATTSMATLLYSDVIKKIYIYKTYDEMNEEGK